MERDINSELQILNKMITSLVEILEDKGVMTSKEWEQKIGKEDNGGNKK